MSTFEEQSCIRCFMQFGVPSGFTAARRSDNITFYCPGCGQNMSYRETEADRLRREIDKKKQNEAYLNDEIKRQRERADANDRRRIALAGQVTKLKKRTAVGVCPCCNRSFSQLARHMNEKHPGFVCEPLADNVIPLDRTVS